jgi:serine/threonine-protein kinase
VQSHLEPATFHGFVAGTLSTSERDEAIRHLDACQHCRQLLSALAKEAAPDVTLDARPFRKGRSFQDAPTAPASPISPKTDGALTDRLVGTKLGGYVVQERIAQGGMGAIYRGVHPVIRKQVALKVLLHNRPAELDFAARMLAEARTVNAIRHPNIIDIFNFGELPDGRPYLVMEFIDGVPLSQWVRRFSGSPPLSQVLPILEQLAAVLEAVHAVGVVHRDLKPANIMITTVESTPRVKVLDFGFAKSRDALVHTSPELVLGTPGYMAPEQIRATPVAAHTDLYALGLIAWFMVTGKEPYSGKSPVHVLQQQLRREPTSLRGQPGVPDELAQLVADLTRIDPSLRPRTAASVRARIQAVIAGKPIVFQERSPADTTQRDLSLAGVSADRLQTEPSSPLPVTTEQPLARSIAPATSRGRHLTYALVLVSVLTGLGIWWLTHVSL